MKSRGRVAFRFHIDHIENDGGLVWALSYGSRYFVLKQIDCRVPVVTVFRGVDAKQPRAFLTGVGQITINENRAVITNE